MNALRAGCALVLALAGATACAGKRREPMQPLGPTLQIVNKTSFEYRVTVSPSLAVVVHPGQTTCVRLGTLHGLRTVVFHNQASDVTLRSPPQNFMTDSGWIVEIEVVPKYDVLSLRPWDPCKH